MTTETRRSAETDAYVKRVVDAAPPLTPAQRDRLAILLHPDPDLGANRAARKAS